MSIIARMRAGANIETGDVISIGNEPIGIAISDSDLDGVTHAVIHGSTFNNSISLGENSQLHNCYINGGVEMFGNNCVVTGCMVYPGESAGITISNPPQNRVQLSHEGWPLEAVGIINEGRSILQSRGFVNTNPTLVGPQSILRRLDEPIANTDVTYRQFLMRNGLLASVYETDDDQEEIFLTIPHEGSNVVTGNMLGAIHGFGATRFSEETVKKAWKLLEEYMSQSQYFAFMEGSKIELENKTGDFRLLIDKHGSFSVLEGKRGEGILATSGRIKSYDYPLGDEIATFLDWFRFKTRELIAEWNCGTYGIVKEGQRR